MTKTQTAAVYYANRDIRLESRPVPEIKPDELLIEITASGICGSDVMEWYRLPKAPLILGHEIAARVAKTGGSVKNLSEGDRVVVSHHVPCMKCRYCLRGQETVCDTLRSTHLDPGGFCEYARVPAINVQYGVFKLPPSVGDEEGSMVEPLGCTLRGQRLAGVKKGATVAVIGAGNAGLLHILAAKAAGASKIFACDINQERLKLAKSLGAEIFDAKSKVLADVVILCAAAPSAIELACRSVDRGGTLLLFAPPEAGKQIPLPLFDLWRDNITLVSSYAAAPKDMEEAIALIAGGLNLKPLISHRLSLQEAGKGFQLVSEAKECLKVILMPGKGK